MAATWEIERDAWTVGDRGPVTLPVPSLWPAAMLRAQRQFAGYGWLTGVTGGLDSAGRRYLTLDAITRDREVRARATWHSRATDGRSLRLFSCMLFGPRGGWHDVTAKRLMHAADEFGR